MTLATLILLAALGAAAAPKKAAPPPPPEPPPSTRPAVAAAHRWACFYGANLSERAWRGLELAVVDPDTFQVPAASAPVRLAYVSLGEADERRSFWPLVSGRPFVIEPNPDWPKAHRVDIRSQEWQRLLLERVVPDALAKGYAGVMLDTVDVAEYFESSAPARFGGSVSAAVDFVRKLRAAHPNAAILINNGLPVVEQAADAIDGVVVEDLYTRCPPRGEACGPTPEADAALRESRLRAFAGKNGKPVFVLLYGRVGERNARWLRAAVRRTRERGFRPYVASPSLERLGSVDPRGKP